MKANKPPAVTKIGYVIPVAVFSTVFLSIGTGLYSLLQPGSSSGKWIGFQILGGVGFGAGLQLVRLLSHGPIRPFHPANPLDRTGNHSCASSDEQRRADLRHRFRRLQSSLRAHHRNDALQRHFS